MKGVGDQREVPTGGVTTPAVDGAHGALTSIAPSSPPVE